MKLCNITRNALNIVMLVVIALLILKYVDKPLATYLTLVWGLVWSYISIKDIKDKECKWEEFS